MLAQRGNITGLATTIRGVSDNGHVGRIVRDILSSISNESLELDYLGTTETH